MSESRKSIIHQKRKKPDELRRDYKCMPHPTPCPDHVGIYFFCNIHEVNARDYNCIESENMIRIKVEDDVKDIGPMRL